MHRDLVACTIHFWHERHTRIPRSNTACGDGLVAAAHDTAGTVTIYRLDSGDRVLRLTDFHTSNGPDVHVYLTSAAKVNSNGDVTSGKYLDLGTLKGNIGNQNYEIPANVDLNEFHSVSIWCARFHVNFGAAQLN